MKENVLSYPDPYHRPGSEPDRFLHRLSALGLWLVGLMLLWYFLPTIESWFSPIEGTPRTVTVRGDLAAGERANIELFEKSRDSVVFISTARVVRDVWTRNAYTVPRGTGSRFIWVRRISGAQADVRLPALRRATSSVARFGARGEVRLVRVRGASTPRGAREASLGACRAGADR